MKRFFIICGLFLMSFGTLIVHAQTPQEPQLRPWHKSLSCQSCHSDSTQIQAPSKGDCLICHQSEENVAQRTAHLSQKGVNPHDNYHYEKSMDCISCHREHSKSYDGCNQCHNFSQWVKPTP